MGRPDPTQVLGEAGVLVRVSIESFDVERADHNTLVRWLLGILAMMAGTLAIIGWPLPIPSGRYVQDDAWERTVALIAAWWNHDGWRMSGSSWFWGGAAIAAATGGVLTSARQDRPWLKKWLLILIPGGAVAALGPLLQVLLGVHWSNYSPDHDGRAVIVVYVVGLAFAVGLPILHGWVMRDRDESADANAPVR